MAPTIKKAIMRKLQYQIDNSNYGMFSTAQLNISDEQLLNREGYKISGNTILNNQNEPVAHIQRNWFAQFEDDDEPLTKKEEA